MPKIVNHDEKKAQIIEAFLDLSTTSGLENVSLRGVASHANVSLRQVQYYFGTKDTLVLAGLHSLEQQSHQAVAESLSKIGEQASASDTIKAIFEQALPTDEQSQRFHHLWMSYAMLSITQPGFEDKTLLTGTDRLQAQLESLLNQGVADGEFSRELNVALEAVSLLGLINGLGTAVLLKQQTVKSATSAFMYQFSKLSR
ncbi:TetR/AcrR family transcriptional regulator [Vibrio gigantis]|uniref:TetR/AcrR family transcriptional regulator n=1 Tax=Vibrio gigantis TaxID=296199 RepID=UPI003D13F504